MSDNNSLLRVALIVLLVLIALPLLFAIVMMPTMGMFGAGHMWEGSALGGTGWWISVILMMAIPLIVLILIGYVIYRALANGSTGSTDPAIQQLKEAYARGEISDEEFDRRLDRLKNTE